MYFAGVIPISYEAEAAQGQTQRVIVSGTVRRIDLGNQVIYAILADHEVWYAHDALVKFVGQSVAIVFRPEVGRIDIAMQGDHQRLGTLELGPGEA